MNDLCRIFGLMCVLYVAFSIRTWSWADTTFYVAPDGNDLWTGLIDAPTPEGNDGPLATLEGARNAIRRVKTAGLMDGPVRVLIRGGVYRRTTPFVLSPEDSGTWKNVITYAAYPGEYPVISGGKIIDGWKQEAGLWTAELPEVRAGTWRFNALWVNHEHLRPARWPNSGFYYTAGKAPAAQDPATGEALDRSKTAFVYRPGDIEPWTNIEDALVVVYHSWDVSYGRIAEIDEANRLVTFRQPTSWAFEHWGPRQRYFIENVFEALDAPGEWYLNRKTGVLYYRPRAGETPEATRVVAPVVQHLVRFEGDLEQGEFVEHIRLEGLSFQHTDFPISPEGMPDRQAAFDVDAAIQAEGARYCVVEDCEISRISNYAVWLREGCRDNRIVRNHIHDLGAGGVRIGHGRDAPNEHAVTMRNVIDNNWIHDGGQIFPAAVGVWIGRSSYNTVSHNDISDFYYTGVSVGWSWGYQASSAHHNIIEYNHIHHLGKWVLSDMGGIYTLGIAPGTVLRNNLIHDVYSYSYGGWGIYPDEGSTDLLIENNIVYNTKTGGFHQHYGRENRVQNNIFAFALEGQIQRSREEEHISFFFERNIVYFDRGSLLSSNWNNGNFLMDRNCYWEVGNPDIDFAGRTFDEWRDEGYDLRSVIADPLFRDPRRRDFRLNPQSPALALGFRPIDVSQIGLYGLEEWTSRPSQVRRDSGDSFPALEPHGIQDGFENTEVGQPARNADTLGETDTARIRVTDEVAATGTRSLKFTDAAGLDRAYNPHLVYSPNLSRGTARARFALRLEPGAVMFHEWRTGGHPYHAGPSVFVDEEGLLKASGKEVAKLDHGTWYRIEIECGLGARRPDTYSVAVKDLESRKVADAIVPLGDARFRRLNWFGFVANADADAVFYMDDLELLLVEEES